MCFESHNFVRVKVYGMIYIIDKIISVIENGPTKVVLGTNLMAIGSLTTRTGLEV